VQCLHVVEKSGDLWFGVWVAVWDGVSVCEARYCRYEVRRSGALLFEENGEVHRISLDGACMSAGDCVWMKVRLSFLMNGVA